MAPSGKFKLNRKTIKLAMTVDAGVNAAVDRAAESIADKAGPTATVDHYLTDRHVAGVVVGATAQARDGAATKAAQQVAADNAGKNAFVSRAQWRFYFRSRPAGEARSRARKSGSYHGLPEHRRKLGGGRRG